MKRRDCAGTAIKRGEALAQRLCIFGLIFMLCLAGSRAVASSVAVGTGYINEGGTKTIYAMPDLSSGMVSTLAVGEACEILFIQEDWLEIAYYNYTLGRQTGWVTSDDIIKAPGDYPAQLPTDPAQQPTGAPGPAGPTQAPGGPSSNDYGIALVSASNGLRVHMRLLPWETSESMGLYYNGVKVVCHSDPGDEWVTVSVEGHRGYMKSEYLYRGNDPGSVVSAIPIAVVVNLNPNSWLNMRDEPTKAGQVIGRLHNGTKVTVLGGTEEWYHVKSGGLAGFVMAKYLQISENQPEQPQNGSRHYWKTQEVENYTAEATLTETSKNSFDVDVVIQYKYTANHFVQSYHLYINDKLAGIIPACWPSENHVTVPTEFRGQVDFDQAITFVTMMPVMDTGEELENNTIFLGLRGR